MTVVQGLNITLMPNWLALAGTALLPIPYMAGWKIEVSRLYNVSFCWNGNLLVDWSTSCRNHQETLSWNGLRLTVSYLCCIWSLQQEPSPPLDRVHTALRKPLCAAPIENRRPTPWAAALSIAPWTPCPPQTNTPSLLSWALTSWPKHPVLVTPSLGDANLEVRPRTYLRLQVLVDITAQIPVSTSRDSLRSLCWADTLLQGSPR